MSSRPCCSILASPLEGDREETLLPSPPCSPLGHKPARPYFLPFPVNRLVKNALYTWHCQPTEIGRHLEAPSEQWQELLDRQGNACITPLTPAVAVLCPGVGQAATAAVVLSTGRVLWREMDKGAKRDEYTVRRRVREGMDRGAWPPPLQ